MTVHVDREVAEIDQGVQLDHKYCTEATRDSRLGVAEKSEFLTALVGDVDDELTIGNQRLTSKMVYHNGPVLGGTQDFYVIWYGCWNDNCGFAGDTKTTALVEDFFMLIGNSPYAQINSTYTDSAGTPAASAYIYGGSVPDTSYSHGFDLTPSDITGIISDQINNFPFTARSARHLRDSEFSRRCFERNRVLYSVSSTVSRSRQR